MPRGRPRKYQSGEEAAEAARQLRQQRYQRQRQAQAPPEFIAYAPTIPGAPTSTCPNVGLRVSADVPVPQDILTQPEELLEGEHAHIPPCPLAPPAVDDVEAAAIISRLRASDGEQTNERIEYEQLILQQMKDRDARAAGILLEMQAGTGNVERPVEPDNMSIHSTAIRSHVIENSHLRQSPITAVAEEPAAGGEARIASARSVSHISTSSPAKAANAPAEAMNSPRTPSQRSVSSARSSGRRKAFPTQRNTLLSWVRPVSRQPSENSNTSQPAQPSPSHSAPPLMAPSSNRSTPCLPQPSNNNSTPPPTTASPSPFARPGNVPNPGVTRAASSARSTPRAGSPLTPPTKQTAYRLAKQL